MQHHTKYGRSGFGFLAFLHFLVGVPAYKCSTPFENLHGFIHYLEIPRFMHVGCMLIQFRLYVPLQVEHLFSTPSSCC